MLKIQTTKPIHGYEWCGYGITLYIGNKTVWLQGDEAAELYDQLEACETQTQQNIIIDQYSEIAE